MIPTGINPHVSFLMHVTFHALHTFPSTLMEMMGRGVKASRVFIIGHMTTRAQLISESVELNCMRIMTINALNSLMKHFTLDVRAIYIYLVVYLSVHMIGVSSHIR